MKHQRLKDLASKPWDVQVKHRAEIVLLYKQLLNDPEATESMHADICDGLSIFPEMLLAIANKGANR